MSTQVKPSAERPTTREAAALSLEEDLRLSARSLLRLLPLLTAVGLATLYLIGAIVKVGELNAAGVAASDALPLVPLQQLLAGALPIVVDSVLLVPVAVVVVHLSWRFADRLGAHFSSVSKRAAGLQARAQALEQRATALDGAAAERDGLLSLRPELDSYIADVAELRGVRLVRWSRPVVTIVRRVRVLRYALAAAVGASLLTLWLFTSPLMIAAIGAGLTAASALRPRPVLAGVAVYGVFLCAVLLEAYVQPAPLPIATVRTLDHRLQRGRLVAITDAQWHLAFSDHRLVSVPVSQMARSSVVSQPARGAKPTWRILRDLVQ